MADTIWKYPLDLTGSSVTNLVLGEEHTIPPNTKRAFATNNGPFYSDSLKVRLASNNQPLTPGDDFQTLYLYPEATYSSGLPVMAVINITNKEVIGDVIIDYQVPGGQYSSNIYALEELIASLEIDNSAVAWENIDGKPVTFPPSPHLHSASDLYGFEYLVDAINHLIQAVLIGDSASHDQIYLAIQNMKVLIQGDYNEKIRVLTARVVQVETDLNNTKTDLQAQIDSLRTIVTTHVTNKNNPHDTDYIQTGAVPVTRTINGKPLTGNITLVAGDVGAYSKIEVDNIVNAHANRTDNPHQTTYTQTGAVPITRTVNGKPLNANITLSAGDVGAYTQAQTTSLINAHANRTDNPHGVTSTQTQSVPITRTINGKALSANITLTPADIGAVPTSRTVNGLPLTADITLTAAHTGAVPITRKINGQALDKDITVSGVLVGTILPWPNKAVPPGWFKCADVAIPENCVKLRNIVGVRTPDFRGVVPRGRDEGRGIDSEPVRDVLTYQKWAMERITGYFNPTGRWYNFETNGAFYLLRGGGSSKSGNDGDSGLIGFDSGLVTEAATETRMANIAVTWIIAGDFAGTFNDDDFVPDHSVLTYRSTTSGGGIRTVNLTPGTYSVLAVGGGGAGAGWWSDANLNSGGSGSGGGSGKAVKTRLTVAIGDVITVQVGAGGAGGGNGGNGLPGAPTIITKNGQSVILAQGGGNGAWVNTHSQGGSGGSGGGNGTGRGTNGQWGSAGAGGTNGSDGGGNGAQPGWSPYPGGKGEGANYYDTVLQSVDPTILHGFEIGKHGAGGAGRGGSGSTGGGGGGIGTSIGKHNYAGQGYGGGGSPGPNAAASAGTDGMVSIYPVYD